MTIALDSDTVLMPVELRYTSQVAELLAELRAGREAPRPCQPDSLADSDVVQVPGQGGWTRVMIQDLVERAHYDGVLALLDRCADPPGKWVMKSEAEEAQGISAVQLRNELGALSKLTKRLFNLGKPTWPMQWKKEQGSYYYRMDERIAEWWTEARKAAR